MFKGFKKVLSFILSMAIFISSVSVANVSFTFASDSHIVASSGWLESAYIKWEEFQGYDSYKVYIKGANESNSSYVELDNELIRKYPGVFRADALGLKAGDYVMKVVPGVNGSFDESKAEVSSVLSVLAYDRNGSAFSSKSKFYGKGVGAYNNDGTLKDGAKVLYITKDTAKTVSTDVITDSKGTKTTYVGFQNIIDGLQKGYDTTPISFRIIGTINLEDMDKISSSAEGLQVKGKSAGSELNMTIEGVGDDATIKGFGILCRNAGNLELRNFAFMLCLDDSISIDTNNDTVWVHNMDLLYGKTGGDADQAKGDGTVDIKGKSTHITVSYNHFWDSGKSSLCGMGTETSASHITYHHNWFDHSDSRHPRIRTQSVHIYNNYFDGNSKYGVGVTLGSSAFVESNYFRNNKHPMLISKQGSDIMENNKTGVADFTGTGTFSGEAGGIIKAYNNHIEGADANKFGGGSEPVYYDANDTKTNGAATQFDAYLAKDRSEKVPSNVVSVLGGNSYNNFDTDTANFDLGVDEKSITKVEDVPSVVKKYAGRVEGGDFKNSSSFTILNDDSSYAVDTVLKGALTNYSSSLISVGGIGVGSNPTTETTTEATTESTTQTTTETTTETTTVGTKVEIGEAVTSANGSNISVTYNESDKKWTLNDASDSLTAELSLPFEEQSKGRVLVSGSVAPSVLGSKWYFLQIHGKRADGTNGEVFSFGGGASKNELAYRLNGDSNSVSKIGALEVKEIKYELIFDFDKSVVNYNIDGIKGSTSFDGESINSVKSVTSKSGLRNVVLSVPYVAVLSNEVNNSTTEATTKVTTESTTEATTKATTESTTEATTKATTESTTEATTKATTESTTEATTETTTDVVIGEEVATDKNGNVYGDINGNGKLDCVDASMLLEMILEDKYEVIAGLTDLNVDGKVNSEDVAIIIQKVNDSSWKMPCEEMGVVIPTKNPETTTKEVTTKESTTETTTEATTVGSDVVESNKVVKTFEENLESDFFSIFGNIASNKGTATFEGKTYSKCLKMESSTSIKFNVEKAGVLTLVFGESDLKRNCKIDNVAVEADSNGVLRINLEAGSHDITKKDTCNLFYISFE